MSIHDVVRGSSGVRYRSPTGDAILVLLHLPEFVPKQVGDSTLESSHDGLFYATLEPGAAVDEHFGCAYGEVGNQADNRGSDNSRYTLSKEESNDRDKCAYPG